MSTRSTMARAPAARAPGDRGARGRVAASLVVAATLSLLLSRFRSIESGSGGGPSGWQFQYVVHSPGWSTLGFVVAALALACGGTVLWLARGRRGVALGAVLALAGVGALGWTLATPNDIRVSPAAYRSIRASMAQTQLTSRLGSPFSTDASATRPRGGGPIACLVYRSAPSVPAPGSAGGPGFTPAQLQARSPDVTGLGAHIYLFCFDHGRLMVKSAV